MMVLQLLHNIFTCIVTNLSKDPRSFRDLETGRVNEKQHLMTRVISFLFFFACPFFYSHRITTVLVSWVSKYRR